MSAGRHSYVRFFASDWLAGTARMTRLHKSIYHDICVYIWDKVEPCPATELPLMLGDLPNWRDLLEDLVSARKLIRLEDGSISQAKAMEEAQRAYDTWLRKSTGGRQGAAKTNRGRASGSPAGTADGIETPDGNGDAYPDSIPDSTPVESPDGIGLGLPTQNQNQNQNQNQSNHTHTRAREPGEWPRREAGPDWEPNVIRQRMERVPEGVDREFELEQFRLHRFQRPMYQEDFEAAWAKWLHRATPRSAASGARVSEIDENLSNWVNGNG